MPLHLGLTNSHQQEEAREARRLLQEKVRNTWSYPLAPHPDTHTSSAYTEEVPTEGEASEAVAAPWTASTTSAPATLDFEPVGWRERDYSDNDNDSFTDEDEDDMTGDVPMSPSKATTGGSSRPRAGTNSSVTNTPTKTRNRLFSRSNRSHDSTESNAIATDSDFKKRARKKRRAQELETEMSWNIGLAHFTAQRNAWTAARTLSPSALAGDIANATINDTINDTNTSPRTSDDPTSAPANITTTTQQTPDDSILALPLCPRLLPNNPVRSRISNSTYSEIYSKVILQGRTPTVPINLQDCTNALIHGWKEEGNWPPKDTEAEASVAGKRKGLVGGPGVAGAGPGSVRHPHLTKVVTKLVHGLTGSPLDTSPRKGGAGAFD